MSLTLLIDLDDTLLSNGMDTFLPAYFHKLSTYLADLVDNDFFIRVTLESIQKSVENKDPSRTLLETFECSFYSKIGLPRTDLQPRFDRFYREVFPELKTLTHPRPAAVALIDECFDRGYRVVIATNPLFPLAAVEHRLEWAGMPTDKYAFAHVANLETYHFAKPNPAFFAEALAQIGWPAGPVIVIGDDPLNDISPAKALGFSSYHVKEQAAASTESRSGVGPLEHFLSWLDRTGLDHHLPNIASAAGLVSTLAAIPGALHSALASQPEERFDYKPAFGEWSITEVLCHLRDVELEVHQPRFLEVLSSENPFLAAENTDAWAEARGSSMVAESD